jgi:predicted dehydrogenase
LTTAGEPPVRFGVIAPTSMVARLAVIPAIISSTSVRLEAVASLSSPQAAGVAPEGDTRRYKSYEDLIEDPAVEAVYIPLPNSLHREWTERAAAAGKHVLCEKPLAATPDDAAAMASACREAGVVLMEAYMTPFHPRSRAVLDIVRQGRLGRVWYGTGTFTGRLDRPDDHRWRPEMGGGALLDVGIYCLSPLLEATGVPTASFEDVSVLRAMAHRAPLGVDASFEGVVDLGGAIGLIRCSFEAPECQRVALVGTEATLIVDRAFTPSWSDNEIRLVGLDGSVEVVTAAGADPYRNMVEHFATAVARRRPDGGRISSAQTAAELARPPEASVALARLIARLESASR